MSLTTDAVSALKSRLFSVTNRPDGPDAGALVASIVAPAGPEINLMGDDGLMAVGRDSANIRDLHDAILRKASLLTTLQDDLYLAFERTYGALDQLADARSQLAQAEAVAHVEKEARETTQQRMRELSETGQRTTSELEKMRIENKRLVSALHQVEEKARKLETENASLSETLAQTQAELEHHREQGDLQTKEIEALRAELQFADQIITVRSTELMQAVQRSEIAEQTVRSLNSSLEEVRVEAAMLGTSLEDERISLASANSRLASLDAQLRDVGESAAQARALAQTEGDKLRRQITELKGQLSQTEGLEQLQRQLLAQSQAEQQSQREKLNSLDRRLAEAELAADQAMQRAANAEAARLRIEKEIASSKKTQKSLLRRVKPLISALRDRTATAAELTAVVAELEERQQAAQRDGQALIEQMQEREAGLVAQLEAERVRRIVSEGALAIDRSLRAGESAYDVRAIPDKDRLL